MPARPGAARSRCTVAADAARCSVPAAAAVRRSPEAVAQQDVRAGGPAPGAASLSARQEAPGVEAPVHVAPHKAQQGAHEDRVSPQVAAVQVCDGLEGVDATHLQGPDAGRRGSAPAFQNRRRESEARRRPQQPVHVRS